MPTKAPGQTEVPVHWVDICRVLRIMGMMEDFSQAECVRISGLLKKRIEAGGAKKISRGVYATIHPEHVTPDHAP